MQSSSNISSLGAKARLKARLVYYSFPLHGLYSLYLLISKKDLAGFLFFLVLFDIFIAYKFRPSNMQTLIDGWVVKDRFPLKRGSGFVLRAVLTLSFVQQILHGLKTNEIFNSERAPSLLFALPLLVFAYDKELEKFIWRNSVASKRSVLFVLLYAALIVLPYGCGRQARHTSSISSSSD